MKYTESTLYRDEIEDLSAILELLNLRPSTVQGYLQTLFDCCSWIDDTFHISLKDADYLQLRRFLLYLHRDKDEGGKGYKPRTVNVYNCCIKCYFRYIVRKPLTSIELPLMKVDRVLPKVPSREEVRRIIMEMPNLRNRMILALGYGCALRLNEVLSLRFSDISFKKMQVTVRADISKNREEGKVELPRDLASMLYTYWKQCRRGAKPEDYLFPGRKPGAHLSDGAVQRFFAKHMAELGWQDRKFHFHSLRHAHALHYYQSGADLFQVQVRLRHKSIAATMIYVQLDAELRERTSIANPFDNNGFKA